MTRTYDERVQAYEAEGMTRSDAQGIVDMEDMKQSREKKKGKNAMTQTHTPGPWRVVHTADDRTFIDTEESNDNFIAQVDRNIPEYENNAAYIVRACNAHDELVKALEQAENIICNILTDSQLDTRTACGVTVREFHRTTKNALALAQQP